MSAGQPRFLAGSSDLGWLQAVLKSREDDVKPKCNGEEVFSTISDSLAGTGSWTLLLRDFHQRIELG